MLFQWDDNKAAQNLQKHRVSFREAATVFGDPMAVTFADPDHSAGENRFLTFGVTRTEKMTLVSHTENNDDTIRIISARLMSKRERAIYEEA